MSNRRKEDNERNIASTTRHAGRGYAIRVQGHLEAHWATWFDGLRLIQEERGATVLTHVYEPGSHVPLARIDRHRGPSAQGTPPATTTNVHYLHTNINGVVCQDSCPRTQPVFSNAWRSGFAGLSQTVPGRVQLRGAPDQRSGFLARACS